MVLRADLLQPRIMSGCGSLLFTGRSAVRGGARGRDAVLYTAAVWVFGAAVGGGGGAGGREGSGRGPLHGGVLGLRGGVVDGRAVSGWGSGQDLHEFHEGARGLRLLLALGAGLAGGRGHLRYGGAAR